MGVNYDGVYFKQTVRDVINCPFCDDPLDDWPESLYSGSSMYIGYIFNASLHTTHILWIAECARCDIRLLTATDTIDELPF